MRQIDQVNDGTGLVKDNLKEERSKMLKVKTRLLNIQ